MPVPKHILQREAVPEDRERYQTVYAKHEGAVAKLPPQVCILASICSNGLRLKE